MNFTNSPYERMMKEIPHYEKSTPQKAPEESPCAGVSLLAGHHLCFLLSKAPQKAGLIMLAFGPE